MTFPPIAYEKGFALMADHLESAGLRLEDNLRVADAGIAFTHAAAAVINSSGTPAKVSGNKSLEGLGIDRSEGFWHPLTERYTPEQCGGDPDGGMNMWGCASFFVSSALGWLPGLEPTAKGNAAVVELASAAAPTTDIKALMRAARYHDASLLKLVGLVQAGLTAKFDKAIASD